MSSTPDTPTRILTATRLLLEERGAASTRLADIASAAGVSRQAVYLHFGSRGGLLVALVQHMDRTSGLGERLSEVFQAPTGVEALVLNQRVTADFAPAIHAVAMALAHVRDTDEGARSALDDRLQSRLDGLTTIVARIEEEGRLAPGWTVASAAEAVWALGLPAMWQHLGVERGWSTEAFARFLIDGAERLIVAPVAP